MKKDAKVTNLATDNSEHFVLNEVNEKDGLKISSTKKKSSKIENN